MLKEHGGHHDNGKSYGRLHRSSGWLAGGRTIIAGSICTGLLSATAHLLSICLANLREESELPRSIGVNTSQTYAIKGCLAITHIQIKHSVDTNEDNAAPLSKLHTFRPVWSRPLQLRATSIASLEAELMLLGELGEVWWPCFLALVWVVF